MQKKTLILGACGQIGTELTLALRQTQDPETIIASDIREGNPDLMASGPFSYLDVLDKNALDRLITSEEIEVVYLMAAMLSAKAEQFPQKAWNLNMQSLLHVLDLGKENRVRQIFWPSSIAVFGPGAPKEQTPQNTIMDPTTVYGISKLAGERWTSYYHKEFGVDVRSIRFPGLLSWKTNPGGGTTDYAIEMYQSAAQDSDYTCYLNPDTRLPMMYMDDAIRAVLELMGSPKDSIKIRSSYNLAAYSFTPNELAESIRTIKPEFKVSYKPDFRQEIATSWPGSIDDMEARSQWGWKPEYDLGRTTDHMLQKLA